MASWFIPRCPVKTQEKVWIEERMEWLCQEFSYERMAHATVVLPTKEFFPDAYDGSEVALRKLLDRVCGYMDIDPQRIEMRLYSEHRRDKLAPGIYVANEGDGTAGLYQKGARHIVSLEVSDRRDPISLLATIAHELCHARLIGEGRISRDVEDHEPLTDLATVFFGLGVFNANSVVRESRWADADGWSGWRMNRQGYLTEPMFGYALALFAWARNEANPPWQRHLRLNVRTVFKKGLGYLCGTGDSKFSPQKNRP
jgi:hypothetical protein